MKEKKAKMVFPKEPFTARWLAKKVGSYYRAQKLILELLQEGRLRPINILSAEKMITAYEYLGEDKE
ncbi:MAG: hypothetical protein QXO20_08680 [Candidatus Bathyarchaeia archaeon]